MESLILGSHNFLLFVILFTISLGLAVHSFFSYERTVLAYLTVAMFLVCSLRACFEFGMHLTDSLTIIHHINRFNSVVAHLHYVLSFYILYFYVLPFRNFKYSKEINIFFSVVVFGIPNLLIIYFFYTFQCFEFSTEKIDGYWMYRPIESGATTFYLIYLFIVQVGIVLQQL